METSPAGQDSLLSECDLWALPDAAHSRWFARLDWYLNWRMLKAEEHKPTAMPAELIRIMEENGVSLVADPREKAAPLLVASAGRLPAALCLVLPYEKNLKSWLAELHSRASRLLAARIRVFLPKGEDVAAAQSVWNGFSAHKIEAQFTTDEATL